jgi:predicted aldo/keto reductase-like oxidoreductase
MAKRLKRCWYHGSTVRCMAMNFRPSEELALALKEQADREHTSVQTVLVKAAEEYLMRKDKKTLIREQVDKIKVDFADALRRLGE